MHLRTSKNNRQPKLQPLEMRMCSSQNTRYLSSIAATICIAMNMLLCLSCSQKEELVTETADGRHLVYIDITDPSGAALTDTNYKYLAPIYNRGTVEVGDTVVQAILLGKKEAKGERLKSHLIGGFSQIKNGSPSYTLLLQTLNKNYNLPIHDFEDFAVNYHSIKRIIEIYELHKHGSLNEPKIKWMSTIKSLRILQQLEQKSAQ